MYMIDLTIYDLLNLRQMVRIGLRLLMNYLNSFEEQTKFGSSCSNWSEIKRGIPQVT